MSPGQMNPAINPDKLKKMNYLNDLQEQIRLKEYRKKMEKMKEVQEEQKMAKEHQEYQDFGRGGVGSVKRDIYGNVIVTKKSDGNLIGNLYGREIYNKRYQQPIPVPPPAAPLVLPMPEPLPVDNVNKYKFEEDYKQQMELEKKIEEERLKRERLEKLFDEERLKREQQETNYRMLIEQEELRKQKELEEAMEAQVRNVKEKVNVKLQTELGPKIREGDVEKDEFIKGLPVKIKSHLTNVVDHELTRLVADMRHDEDQIVSSILNLKVIK